ncbi:MAG: 4-hydroxy-3-methylbut-2-enyl diphosphate reductase, partial [Bacteroidales bacterium]|nr:4-hydroxy-3-methylbut-2-enyl diphosphate reductase [Bacteroidales bacterium]
AILDEIKIRMKNAGGTMEKLNCTQSICQQVSGRVILMRDFCRQFDCILFVSSPKSSNGKVLFEECKSINDRSHFVCKAEDVQKDWFIHVSSVGITGATSTPEWLMEEVAQRVRDLQH